MTEAEKAALEVELRTLSDQEVAGRLLAEQIGSEKFGIIFQEMFARWERG